MDEFFLDTNSFNAYWAGDESLFKTLRGAKKIHVSLIVYGELLAGFMGGNREEENRRNLQVLLDKPFVQLSIPTMNTAEYFALLKNLLRAKGRPIPANDIWLAAQCMEHGALLLSRDTHFEHVEGLRWKPF